MNTILIVDDHAPFRFQARALPEADGFTLVGGSDTGTTGLAAARMLKPYLVLHDIGVPDIEGFDVARDLVAGGPRLANSQFLGFIPKDGRSGAANRTLADAI